jgi:phosphatidylserine decarboxylase
MSKIHDFKTHSDLKNLEDSISNGNQEVMPFLYPYRNKEIGSLLQKIIKKFTKKYETPMNFFEKKKFNTFMEFFTRRLSVEKDKEITSRAKSQFSMVLPAESDVESIGRMGDTSSIVRLKKPGAEVKQDLLSIGIDASQMDFVNMKLQKAYYHRIHSPVTGTIEKLVPVSKSDIMFGENSLWAVDIDTEKHGHVVMLLVGELSIQDFKFYKNEGDHVDIFEQIGRFDWGSQVVMLYEHGMFPGEILVETGCTYFVGDGIFPAKELSSNFGPTGAALGGGDVSVDPSSQRDQIDRNLEPTHTIKKFGELDGI